MGILDTARAFARVGATKARRAASDAGATGARLAADGASKGAAAANQKAGELRGESASPADQPTRPEDGGTSRQA